MASIVMQDYGNAALDDETLAIVEYVEKLTKEPSEMTENDIQTLRKTGLSDDHILSVVMITAMFAFMNRLADGLGVEIEDEKGAFVNSWLRTSESTSSWLHYQPKEKV
ncbi:MAG: hypothetical protein FI704_02740 [SAR202 cluster bacterium]|jgi:uncharacterized peroxidase-related enzyme|nr:hypothetical protein [SAR202 cluster bacterium]|tara:strand:+ start:1433 stop:1756 length:324 start_codon:yes stop_codon:yes gene_type:complete